MREEADDLGFMRETAAYFGAEASDEEFAALAGDRSAEPTAAKATKAEIDPEVRLKDGDVVLKLKAATYSRLRDAAFAGQFRWCDYLVSPKDVQALAEQAEKSGDAALAARLGTFAAAMTGEHAIALNRDGNRWTAPLLRPSTKAAEAERVAAAERDAFREDVRRFFSDETEDGQ